MEIIHPTAPNQHLRVKFPFKTGWTQDLLFIGDCHSDSSECAEDILQDHLAEAKDRKALIADIGDFFDVINSRNDKRRAFGSMHDEDKVDAYVDSVLDNALKRYGKYADCFLYFGTGNHESKLMQQTGTDLTRRFVDELNRLRNPKLPPIYRAGYGGWIRLAFEGVYEGGATGNRQSCNIKIFHGSGGGGEVTKGVMEVQRMAASIGNADVVVTGHVHEQWWNSHVVEELSDLGVARFRKRTHVKVGSYKVDYRLGGEGTWHMQRGGKPKPIGGMWLRFSATAKRVSWTTEETAVDYSRIL